MSFRNDFLENSLPTILQSYKCYLFKTYYFILLSYYQLVSRFLGILRFCRKCCRIVGRCRKSEYFTNWAFPENLPTKRPHL
nr:MAG TPA: hypothetical protein [Caudoviricetes sp.]